MGALSSAWDSIKGAVKSVGKGIKKAFKSVGKFVSKIGIVGQIALMFILPGIGGLIGGMIGRGVTALAASANPILAGVGKVLATAGKFASTVGNVYKTVSNGVTSFVENIGKGFLNKTASLLGKNTPLFSNGPASVTEGFSKWMNGVSHDVSNITSPFNEVSKEVTKEVIENPYQAQLDIDFSTDASKVPASMKDIPTKNMFDQGLDNSSVADLLAQEGAEQTGWYNKVTDYATKTADNFVDNTAKQFASSAGQGIAVKAGLAPEPVTEINTVNNVIPKFDSAPVSNLYESLGMNYGALPSNRVEYYAANNAVNDYGMNSFAQFSNMRYV